MKKRSRGSSGARKRVGRPPAGPGGQRVRDYPQISFRVPSTVRRRLEAMAAVTGQSRSDLIVLALECLERALSEAERREVSRRSGTGT